MFGQKRWSAIPFTKTFFFSSGQLQAKRNGTTNSHDAVLSAFMLFIPCNANGHPLRPAAPTHKKMTPQRVKLGDLPKVTCLRGAELACHPTSVGLKNCGSPTTSITCCHETPRKETLASAPQDTQPPWASSLASSSLCRLLTQVTSVPG